jgi:hypothetical protein
LSAQDDSASPSRVLYNSSNGMLPTLDSTELFNPATEFDWPFLPSWEQFDGLVTAGNGVYDSIMQGSNDSWFGS